MQKFKPGQRVVHEHLGAGTVVKPVEAWVESQPCIMYLVILDQSPPIQYKKATNPMLVFASALESEEKGTV